MGRRGKPSWRWHRHVGVRGPYMGKSEGRRQRALEQGLEHSGILEVYRLTRLVPRLYLECLEEDGSVTKRLAPRGACATHRYTCSDSTNFGIDYKYATRKSFHNLDNNSWECGGAADLLLQLDRARPQAG